MNQPKISRRIMLAAAAGLGPMSLACGNDAVVVKQGLLLDLNAEHLEGEEDGTVITLLRDHSGRGNDLISNEGTAPTYQATDWDGLPSLNFASPPRWMRSTGHSLIAAISGENPHFTLAMLIRPSANPAPGTLWTFGDPDRAHELSGTADATLGLRTRTAEGGEQSPRGSDYDQYTKAPFPQVCTWTLAGRQVTIRVDGVELKLASEEFRVSNFQPTHFALGARLQGDPIDVTGGFHLRRLVAYDRALTPEELSQVEYGLAAFGRLPKCGVGISALEDRPERWDDSWRFVG